MSRRLSGRSRLATLVVACLATMGPLGCASTAPTSTADPVETPSVDEPDGAVATGVPPGVHWVRTGAEYRGLALTAYAAATRAVETMAAEREPGTWAVALDADETVIDNSLYQKERAELGLGYTRESWTEWAKRQEAPPVPGAVAFLERVRELGGEIAIVTNRRADVCADTEADFEKYDIPYDVMLCRTDTGEKEPRWQMVTDGTTPAGLPPLEILIWLGDNIEDFPELDQSLRQGPASGYDLFGERYFLIPNPMYGSWEDNPAS